MLGSRESASYGGKGSVLVQQSCIPLPVSHAQQSAAPMIASYLTGQSISIDGGYVMR
jgi:hypothetical protein